MRPAAVIFDLDGVLVDSEHLWDRFRREVVAEHGGRWTSGASEAMLGMSTPEWGRYLVEELGTRLTPEQATDEVIARMARQYASDPPVLPGAAETVRAVGAHYPVAIASSAPPRIIRTFLETTGTRESVRAVVSSEEVGAGKPEPDVYIAAAEALGVPATECAALEDSRSGLRAALAAGMTVFALPNQHFAPDQDVLSRVHRVLESLPEFRAAVEVG